MKLTVKISGPKCSGKSILAREIGAYLDRMDIPYETTEDERSHPYDPHEIEKAVAYDPDLHIAIDTETAP